MAYLVISYPELDNSDYKWIQEYRKKYDSRYFALVEPHITLVFPADNIEKNLFIAETRRQIEGIQPFGFIIRVATINFDSFGNFYHEFLVPDEGYSSVVKLHDALYSDAFKQNLSYDIDFIPHIGIGNSDDAEVSKARVDQLNAKGLNIQGRVSSVDIVEYQDDTITTIENIKF